MKCQANDASSIYNRAVYINSMAHNVAGLKIKQITLVMAICWSVFLLISMALSNIQHESEINNIIEEIGRTSIERDKLYRLWNSLHGGVYVPVTVQNQPNSYLTPEMVSLRDIQVSPELELTMINPAYMTRQVYDLAQQRNVVSGHITSLNPINPENIADNWEKKALLILEQGAFDYSERIKQDGKYYFRMMMPLKVDKSCLKCHASQGYSEGDLRGGISVTLPVRLFHRDYNEVHGAIFIAHSVIWFVALLGLGFGYVKLARSEAARIQAEKQILQLAHFDSLTGLVNRNLFQDRLTQALAMVNREGRKVAILYIDLDHFKSINDRFGHEAGDAVLKEVGACFSIQGLWPHWLSRWNLACGLILASGSLTPM